MLPGRMMEGIFCNIVWVLVGLAMLALVIACYYGVRGWIISLDWYTDREYIKRLPDSNQCRINHLENNLSCLIEYLKVHKYEDYGYRKIKK